MCDYYVYTPYTARVREAQKVARGRTLGRTVRHCDNCVSGHAPLDVEVDAILPLPPRNSNNLRCLIVCVINVSLSDSHCKEHTMLASAPAGNIASPLPSPR